MRSRLAATVAVTMLGAPSPVWAQEPEEPAARHTDSLQVLAPEHSGAFLSLLVPGMGQFYAGLPIQGAIYLGLAAAGGYGTYSLILAPQDEFYRKQPVAQLFTSVFGLAAFLGVGVLSTVHALADISGRYSAADAGLEGEAPVSRPEPPLPRRGID